MYFAIRYFNGDSYEDSVKIISESELSQYDTTGHTYQSGGTPEDPIFRWNGWDILRQSENKEELQKEFLG